MNLLLRIGFAIVIGVFVTLLLEWLANKVPHGIDVLAGVIAAFIAYYSFPRLGQ